MNYTEEEMKAIESRYYEFSQLFYDNTSFLDVIEQIEKDLFYSFRDSNKEESDSIYYELKGLKRIMDKIYSVKFDYETMKIISEQPENIY